MKPTNDCMAQHPDFMVHRFCAVGFNKYFLSYSNTLFEIVFSNRFAKQIMSILTALSCVSPSFTYIFRLSLCLVLSSVVLKIHLPVQHL
jgi:hypothetical protein